MKRHPVVAAYLVGFTLFGLATASRLTVPYVVMVALGPWAWPFSTPG